MMIVEPEIIKLPIFGITVTLSGDSELITGGTITSDLKEGEDPDPEFDAGVDAIESMILAYAVAGGDITSLQFQTAITTAVEALSNNF